jgi:hypothetical protein
VLDLVDIDEQVYEFVCVVLVVVLLVAVLVLGGFASFALAGSKYVAPQY